ncbi:MAG: MFS transporter [Deinococcales bacterium]
MDRDDLLDGRAPGSAPAGPSASDGAAAGVSQAAGAAGDASAVAAVAGSTTARGAAAGANAPAERFQTGDVATVAGGHFAHDSFTAFVAPLLPVLQQKLNTDYAMTGGLAVFLQLPSLLNPLIGYLADKVSLRYFVILAPAVTATLITLLGRAPNYVSLVLLLVAAGLSVASFHAPAPPMIAHVSGRRVGMGMSLFMAGGELGRTLGPLLAVAAVGWFGLEGLWRLMFIGWAVSGLLYFRLRNVSARGTARRTGLLPWKTARRVFPAIGLLIATRVMLLVAATTYLPLFMKNVVGSGLWLAGASLSILEAAGVVGALSAGTISDRIGRGSVLMTVAVAAPIVMIAFLYAPSGLAAPLLVLLGLSAVSATPVILASVQDAFPDNRALANGTFMAMNFMVRAAGIYIIGLIADGAGLERAFLVAALVAFLGIPAVPLLFRRPLPA